MGPAPSSPASRTEILAALGLTAVLLLLISRVWLALDPVPLLPVTFSWRDAGLGILLGLGLWGSSSLIYQLWPAYRDCADAYLAFVVLPLTWVDVLWLGLLPALSEELLFRGVMLPAFGYSLAGLVWASLCFGVLHLVGLSQWPYALWATVVGFGLGAAGLGTGNLLVPVIAHGVTNWIGSLVWKARHGRPAAPP